MFRNLIIPLAAAIVFASCKSGHFLKRKYTGGIYHAHKHRPFKGICINLNNQIEAFTGKEEIINSLNEAEAQLIAVSPTNPSSPLNPVIIRCKSKKTISLNLHKISEANTKPKNSGRGGGIHGFFAFITGGAAYAILIINYLSYGLTILIILAILIALVSLYCNINYDGGLFSKILAMFGGTLALLTLIFGTAFLIGL